LTGAGNHHFVIKSARATPTEYISGCYHSNEGTEQWVLVDTLDQFDGLERLIAVAVDLDSVMD
jgi:hypothetical protein